MNHSKTYSMDKQHIHFRHKSNSRLNHNSLPSKVHHKSLFWGKPLKHLTNNSWICIGKLNCSIGRISSSIHLMMSTKRRLIAEQHSFELNFSNNNKANTGMCLEIARSHCNTNFEMVYSRHWFCMNHYMTQ